MMNIACNLSCSVAVMVLLTGTALAYPSDTSKSLKLNTHTYSKNSIRESTLTKLASVCFITDTEDCQGGEFGGSGSTPEWNPDPDNRCDKEGYLKTSCEPLWEPYNYCPYDKKYWEKCICKTTLIPCNAPNIGVGPACDGKYEKCCNNTCPAGYDLNSGSCRKASSLKTACGNACYKILSNTCSTGSLNPPAETGGNRNKSVETTECGNLCWQSFSDNCPTGYVKAKAAGKCYEMTVSYTPYGSACYKEKPCCNNTCSSGSLTPPTETGGNRNKLVAKTECGNSCWQSFSDNCEAGYSKSKIEGRCYDPSVKYTAYGSTCYREISCKCKLYYIYYSDHTCSENLLSDKKPVGVVYWTNEAETGGMVVGLEQIKDTGSKALEYCQTYYSKYGIGGWKIPEINELFAMRTDTKLNLESYSNPISDNKFTFLNNKLSTIPGADLLISNTFKEYWNKVGTYYWSSNNAVYTDSTGRVTKMLEDGWWVLGLSSEGNINYTSSTYNRNFPLQHYARCTFNY